MFPSTSLSHSNSLISPWVIGSTCSTFVFSPLDRIRYFISTSRVFLKFANLKSDKKLMLCLLLSLKYLGFHRWDNRPTWVDIQFLPFYEPHIQSAWMNRSSLTHPCADNLVLQFQVTHSCFSLDASFWKHQMPIKCFSLYWQWFSWLEINFSSYFQIRNYSKTQLCWYISVCFKIIHFNGTKSISVQIKISKHFNIYILHFSMCGHRISMFITNLFPKLISSIVN